MDLGLSQRLNFYKRQDVQEALISFSDSKEIAIRYGKDGGYGKRPDMLRHPTDVIAMVQNGATSFHCSEELWSNPMQLTPQMQKKEMGDLRIGWDLILDIDCPVLAYSQIAADILFKALVYHGIECVTIKFSGNHGFHLAVPFEAFPEEVNGVPTKALFPEGPRRIAAYLKEIIKDPLGQRLSQFQPIQTLAATLGKTQNDLMTNGVFDPFKVLVIDTVLISSRHLYRMPYAFNEKSGLVSIPISPKDIITFDKESARPESVVVGAHPFLVRDAAKGQGARLLLNAFDFKLPQNAGVAPMIRKEFAVPEKAVPLELFPPCIINIMKGLPDGKKRAMFILTNFLSAVGWSHEQIGIFMEGWNRSNPDPIREVILKGHLNHARTKSGVLPPNCDNEQYYKDLQICTPNHLCSKIKNPANYANLRAKMVETANLKDRAKKGYIETT